MKSKIIPLIAILFAVILFSACSEETTLPTREGGQPTAVVNVPQTTEKVSTKGGIFDPATFSQRLGNYVLRPEDLPHKYRIPSGGEARVSNLGVVQKMGEVEGKRYILATGRVDGWSLELERKNKEDIAPITFQSTIEVFESHEGALTALSPDWFKAYKSETKTPSWVEGGCDLGDQCLFYYYKTQDPATNLTKLEYDVAFVYKNVLVWVMGRGLDIDVNPDYVLNAARTLYDKLGRASS